MSLRRFLFCIVALPSLLTASRAAAEDWPQWRGVRLDGISHETGLPVKWDKTSGQNIAWRLPLPGPAGATPVVSRDHIFLTSVDGSDIVLIAADTSGKLLWKKVLDSGNKNVRGDEGNSASPSPSTDGKHVWAMTGTGKLACFDFDGKSVWTLDLQEHFGRFQIQFGMTSTPILDEDRLYLQLIHSGGAVIACLDKETGHEIWRQKRPSDARDECEHSYASPIIYRDGQRSMLLTHGADCIVAHSLTDGGELWRCAGLNPKANYNSTLRFIASPVAAPGLIVVPSAKNGPVLGLRPDGHGDITTDAKAHLWTRPQNTPDVPSPLIHDGLVYLCRENGGLICLDAKTGKQLYDHRMHPDRYRASPVFADGKLYCASRDGTVTVVKTGSVYEELAINSLGESLSSSPAIAGGTLYLRTFDALYAIRSKP